MTSHNMAMIDNTAMLNKMAVLDKSAHTYPTITQYACSTC